MDIDVLVGDPNVSPIHRSVSQGDELPPPQDKWRSEMPTLKTQGTLGGPNQGPKNKVRLISWGEEYRTNPGAGIMQELSWNCDGIMMELLGNCAGIVLLWNCAGILQIVRELVVNFAGKVREL